MQYIVIILGLIVIFLGIIKQITGKGIGYQLISLPGYLITLIGIVLAFVGTFLL